MNTMELRRVQVTGGSSYVITLPKEWITSLKIKKNDPLAIYIQSDGTLHITPKITQESVQQIKEIPIQDNTKQSFLLRHLIAAYIAGFTTIQITSKKRIPTSLRSILQTFTQMAIGPEIIEETETSVTLKDLLNLTEMPFNRTIKRMHIIVKGMHEDVMKALHTKQMTSTTEILSRENEVDRLHWLVARQHNIILQNVILSEKMNTTPQFVSTCFLISRTIERIADHTVKISYTIPPIISSTLEQKYIDCIVKAGNHSIEVFNKSISAFYKKDIYASHETIESMDSLRCDYETINTLAHQQKGIIASSVGSLVESIRRIGEYSQNISETVINYLITEESS